MIRLVMKTTNKKTVKEELKGRVEKKTYNEFPKPKGIHKQTKVIKRTNKRKSHKAIQ